MTVKLRPETEQALLEALALLKSGPRREWSNGRMVGFDDFKRPGGFANDLVEIMCSAIIRDGHMKWPLVVEQRHETPEELAARVVTYNVPMDVAGGAE